MLGFSIYPEKASKEEVLEYITLCNKYNFKRVFTCLLSVNDTKENILRDFQEIISHARSYNMEVVLDVSPRVFEQLGISYKDLSFFAETGATGIRLDDSFNGRIEAEMTYNPHNLDIEINMSLDAPYLDNILAFVPKKGKIIGSHNFYPQKYAGLSYEFFLKTSERYKKNGIRTSAFINSCDAKQGPWPVMEGLCTLEIHRELSPVTQLKHFYATGLIDDVVIANQFASEDELRELSKIDESILEFKIKTNDNSDLENTIIFDEFHFNRGDTNDYLCRSTQSRVKYKAEPFAPHDDCEMIPRGSIVIGNDRFGQYKGELQIVKKDIHDPELQRNVVGKIVDEELFLLDLLLPWQKFKFSK